MNKTTATLLDRTKSSTIDILLLITLAYLLSGILSNIEDVPLFIRTSLFTSLLMYEPICISFGATLGNYFMNIRIRRSSNDSKKLNIFRSVIRFISKLFLGWVSYVTIFKNPRKRALHDLITGATTIKV